MSPIVAPLIPECSRVLGSLQRSRLAKPRDPQTILIQSDRLPSRQRSARRLIHRLVGQAKRSPMNCQRERQRTRRVYRNDVLIDLNRFLGISVNDPHEPAWIVRADRNHHELERAASLANLSELGM